MRKVIYLLNVDKYAPDITALTYPLIYYWADKIRCEVVQITKRKFPSFPAVYEKLQIHQLAKENKADWNIYIDSDTLVSPDTLDFTEHLTKDTVVHNGCDFANVRWKYDDYFRRDGRNIGSCNWFAIASNLCVDLWEPLRDLTLAQALDNIYPVMQEENSGVIDKAHLLDDYVLSRNIAKYGLHFTTIIQLTQRLGVGGGFWHDYLSPVEKKVELLTKVLVEEWKVPKRIRDHKYNEAKSCSA